MSEHEHGKECHCDSCRNDREKTSMEEAGGVAVGVSGHINGFNADAEMRMAKVMQQTGKWVEKESGSLLGHIKVAIYDETGNGITLNLINNESGVEHHGSMEPRERVDFSFMSAVLDVDAHELEHVMADLLEDSGIDYELVAGHNHEHNHSDQHEHSEHCCHNHEHNHSDDHEHSEHCCHNHEHNHSDQHEHSEHCCHNHEHNHSDGHEHSEHCCHNHEHNHSDGHEHSEHCCHEHNEKDRGHHKCEDQKKNKTETEEKSSFWSKLKRKK